jgi:hypothetical protein
MLKSRKIKWTEHVEYMGEKRSAYRVWVGRTQGKKNVLETFM